MTARGRGATTDTGVTGAMTRTAMPLVRRLLAGAAAAALCFGCSGLLEVSNEQEILDKNLDNPDAVTPLTNGVAGDFAVAYANAVDIVGLLGHELIHTGSFPSWREIERGIGT